MQFDDEMDMHIHAAPVNIDLDPSNDVTDIDLPSDEEANFDMVDDILPEDILFILQRAHNIEYTDSEDSDQEQTTDFDYPAPSGRKWCEVTKTEPQGQGRKSQCNILVGKPGIKLGVCPRSEEEAFLMFMDDALEVTLQYTNLQRRHMEMKWNQQNPNNIRVFPPVDRVELNAFWGLLLLAGLFKAQYRPTSELWSTTEGQPVFRATMSMQRFKNIKGWLRFDDPCRLDRTDKLAPVRHLFKITTEKFRSFVIPEENLTVDEQLLEFHGKVAFKQYIASKPGKFGLKLFWLTEAKSSYVLEGLIYTGEQTLPTAVRQEHSSVPEGIVMTLMKNHLGIGRNLVGDNWFTSLSLVDRLKKRRTTYVGTCRRNRRDVPKEAIQVKGRRRGDTRIFRDQNGILLISFWDKGTVPVLLVDSMCSHVPLPPPGNKCETVLHYNANKSGVDTLDKLVRGKMILSVYLYTV